MHQSATTSGDPTPASQTFVGTLQDERVLAVVRAKSVPDVTALCAALVKGGISVVELTFTIPELPRIMEVAANSAAQTGAFVGAGTVLTASDARTAIDAGARFLVTPGLGLHAAEIVGIGHEAGAAVVLGALTPSEVLTAMQLDADVVKIFPAATAGPSLFKDLLGPFPGARLLPSGGVNVGNAQAFLAAGALAVSAGSGVVTPVAVESGDWDTITDNARAFCSVLARP